MRDYYVYIMASRSRVLYVGVTNDIHRRVHQHRSASVGFVARYRVHRLVYVEHTNDVIAAIEREKQIKSWVRSKRVGLIKSFNPKWHDLAAKWFE